MTITHDGFDIVLHSGLFQVTLVTKWRLWSPRRPTLLTLSAPRAGWAGGASPTWGCVSSSCFSRPSDAVPRVTGNDHRWDCASFARLLFLRLAPVVIILLVERVGGRRRGRARSGALPFERGQRTCIGGCCLSGGGRGRGFLLLGFWLDQGKPGWVFGFMGASGQAGQWDTHTNRDGDGHRGEDNQVGMGRGGRQNSEHLDRLMTGLS